MRKIPEDVTAAAQIALMSALTAARHRTSQEAVDIIANAIMAERERCAKLCEKYCMCNPYGGTMRTHGNYVVDEAYDGFHQGSGYAALIRQGVEGGPTAAVRPTPIITINQPNEDKPASGEGE